MPKIDVWFDALLAKGGSDLHLSPGYPPLLRDKGVLVPLNDRNVSADELRGILYELLTPEQRRKIDEDWDLDFAWEHGTVARFRANYLQKTTGLGAVFRVIPSKIKTLEDLGTPKVLKTLADKRAGLVLVTGPTGSGKSTTLAAMIDHINRTRNAHILTIEDPVEFVHESRKCQVTHREIGIHAATFQDAIRSAGREDPNVVLVGELRNNETMKLALQLASYGILVFATVHTNSAPSTIDRIINAFPAEEQGQVRGMLAEGLSGIVAQQLLRTKDGKGRVACHEVLVGPGGVAALIREGKTIQILNLMQGGGALGMQTLDSALEKLVLDEVVTFATAWERASDREGLTRAIKMRRPELVPQNLEH
jgi:twitching motility protein PilT